MDTRYANRVLVTASSKHGATAAIARMVGEVLAEHGFRVSIRPPAGVGSVDGYQACVVGSAVYAGRWRKPARQLITDNAEVLRSRPVWLFSSGPIGDPARPATEPADTAELVELARPREHRVFAGKLDRARLGVLERGVVRAAKAPYGDFRDWDEVRAWATTIAEALRRERERAREPIS